MGAGKLAALAVGFLAASALTLYPSDGRVRRGSPTAEFIALLDARIPKLMRRCGVPGASVALVQNGRIVHTAAYGYADREAGRKMAADLPMRVQPISKSVTAWAVLKLAEEGRLNLDDPVGRHLNGWTLPSSGYPSDGVMIRRFLSHTAGLPLSDVFALYSPHEPTPSLRESRFDGSVSAAGSGFYLLQRRVQPAGAFDRGGHGEELCGIGEAARNDRRIIYEKRGPLLSRHAACGL